MSLRYMSGDWLFVLDDVGMLLASPRPSTASSDIQRGSGDTYCTSIPRSSRGMHEVSIGTQAYDPHTVHRRTTPRSPALP